METVKGMERHVKQPKKMELFFYEDAETFDDKKGFRIESEELSYRLCSRVKYEKSELFDSILN